MTTTRTHHELSTIEAIIMAGSAVAIYGAQAAAAIAIRIKYGPRRPATKGGPQ